MIARSDWHSQVADAWSANSLTVAALPYDENTEAEARAIRECLCTPSSESERASGPFRERTYCAQAGDDTDGAALLTILAEQSGLADAVACAQVGEATTAFYGAIYGVCFIGRERLTTWVTECLRHIRPLGGGPRRAGHLHLLVLLTCPDPSRRQLPFPEGAGLHVSPPTSPGELMLSAQLGVQDLWPAARHTEVAFLLGGLLDMASGRQADLAAAIETLAARELELAHLRAGIPLRWQVDDPPVRWAEEVLRAVGVTADAGSTSWAAASQDDDRQRQLWAAGLWRPPAEGWFAGLTSRAWTALGKGAGPLAIEHAGLELLRQCLMVERLCREVLRRWVDACGEQRRGIEGELWRTPPGGTICLAERVRQRAQLPPDPAPTTREILEELSFGELVLILERVGAELLPSPLPGCLQFLVRARNWTAHGRTASLSTFSHVANNSVEAIHHLYPLLL